MPEPKPEKTFSRSELKDLLKFARRRLRYRRDLLADGALEDCHGACDAAAQAIRDKKGLDQAGRELEKAVTRHCPLPSDHTWRDNVEVFLVAFVLAFAIRTYFLQPFQIPTASMQPTLYGIEVMERDIPAAQVPSWPRQIFEKFAFGNSYVHIVADTPGTVGEIREFNLFLFWLKFSSVRIGAQNYYVWMPRDYLLKVLSEKRGREFSPGETVASAMVRTGDFVFVDKVTYNFRFPRRGEVFVFLTDNIAQINASQRAQGQIGEDYYIKRLSAIGGDKVSFDPPHLLVNGEVARFNPMYDRIYSRQNSYTGYSFPRDAATPYSSVFEAPPDTVLVPEQSYFALGDNSPRSWDSRGWGPVPAENVIGKAFIVFYPFGSRWGFIR